MRKFLKDYESRLNPLIVPTMLRAFNDWISSNRIVFPFPGGRLQQPQWVLTYFDTFESVSELAALEKQRPSPQGLPTREQLFGREQIQ